jgi:four helix bundle protein
VTSETPAARSPRRHHDLVVWQRAIELVKIIYRLTETLPEAERFGLTAQMRRAAVSVPSNIAEGAARRSSKEFMQSLYVARGSLAEIETQLTICRELGFCKDAAQLDQALTEVLALLGGLIRSLQSKSKQ